MRGLVATALLLGGCDRVFATLKVGDGPDATIVDTPIDTACTTVTYGKNGAAGAGLFSMCLTETPQTPLTLPASVDTGSTMCTYTIQHTETGADDLCVIVATDIHIDTMTRASGSLPLVLLATNTISITGTLDVSSMRGVMMNGAGANAITCPSGALRGANGAATVSGAGGAGGTFQTSGGNGGNGSNGATAGAPAGSGGAALTYVRGGCRGGNGGGGVVTANGGAPGAGGGAVYLIAGSSVEITSTGIVNASGEGGIGGAAGNNTGDGGGGGGGGGSGGLIGIDAPTILLASNSRLVANGGGGGGSGPVGGSGTDGKNGSSAMPTGAYPFTAAGGATSAAGGDGADQSMRNGIAGAAGLSTEGGGGGGGGLGFIQFYSPAVTNAGALISPAPT